jgi:hypothetical protein
MMISALLGTETELTSKPPALEPPEDRVHDSPNKSSSLIGDITCPMERYKHILVDANLHSSKGASFSRDDSPSSFEQFQIENFLAP